jgi:outer membrane protein assembly factor BamD
MIVRLIIFISLICLFNSCAKNKDDIYEPSKLTDPFKLYDEGLAAFKENNFFFANKKFSEAELNFSKPELAAKSAIMASYSLYGINFYDEAEENIKRYLKTYPADKHVIYAKYLLAIIYYEQITDEKKDLDPLLKTRDSIDLFLKQYPDTDYATDLRYKRSLVKNQLAAKELYIARYYISVKKWIPAINRLKIILEKYDTTIFVEEALHRLVEIYYYLGLEKEARNYAAILGYNYNSSEWFKKSYKVFDKNYEEFKQEAKKEKKESIFSRIIKIIE